MKLTLPDRALLVKLFYQRKSNASAALKAFRQVKGLRKGPLTITNLRNMILRFEETGAFNVKPGRGRKPTPVQKAEEVATAVVQQGAASAHGSSSARAISRELDMPVTTVWRVMRNILKFYPYKIAHTQQLLSGDNEVRKTFALMFIARMTVDDEWPWQILWSDEAHFHLNGAVNTRNSRIWSDTNPHVHQQIPLHAPKVTVWCGFTSSFFIGPYFFEENTSSGPKTCSVNGCRYAFMLQNFVIPSLQQRNCLDTAIFMQDGAPPHIALPVQALLRRNFSDDRVISRSFSTSWPPRSPDLNPCDFWLWGYLKSHVYKGNVPNLAVLKDRISQCVSNLQTNELRSAVECVVHRMQFLEQTDGGHIEPYL